MYTTVATQAQTFHQQLSTEIRTIKQKFATAPQTIDVEEWKSQLALFQQSIQHLTSAIQELSEVHNNTVVLNIKAEKKVVTPAHQQQQATQQKPALAPVAKPTPVEQKPAAPVATQQKPVATPTTTTTPAPVKPATPTQAPKPVVVAPVEDDILSLSPTTTAPKPAVAKKPATPQQGGVDEFFAPPTLDDLMTDNAPATNKPAANNNSSGSLDSLDSFIGKEANKQNELFSFQDDSKSFKSKSNILNMFDSKETKAPATSTQNSNTATKAPATTNNNALLDEFF